VADGLFVEAISHDGIVEAVSYREKGNFILGVQWHPEWHASTENNDKILLNNYFDYVEKYIID
jgi:putative glutamine amidotransferase